MVPARAAIAMVTTVVGLFLLFSFKTPDTQPVRPRAAVVVPGARTPAPAGTASAGAAPSSGATPSASASGSGAAPSGLRDGTFTGQDVPNEYGDVQVDVVISGGRITDVQPRQMPSDRRRSADISSQAGPLLHDEVLQAQSAQVDTISGATYTSDSYAQSVQSALDQAH